MFTRKIQIWALLRDKQITRPASGGLWLSANFGEKFPEILEFEFQFFKPQITGASASSPGLSAWMPLSGRRTRGCHPELANILTLSSFSGILQRKGSLPDDEAVREL